ncbi:hypothetical protein Pcinc_009895 [Petrolisthes cinctipes]|uniref:Uncharacterized protein n=1 Tax=Petrolisthes cinctipes TaxID=88211 RepID=A0AAE1G448_PETCI|nr:hypothetical protein Pcinc_009895 [Petrolisthes cinctipes]
MNEERLYHLPSCDTCLPRLSPVACLSHLPPSPLTPGSLAILSPATLRNQGVSFLTSRPLSTFAYTKINGVCSLRQSTSYLPLSFTSYPLSPSSFSPVLFLLSPVSFLVPSVPCLSSSATSCLPYSLYLPPPVYHFPHPCPSPACLPSPVSHLPPTSLSLTTHMNFY